MMATKDISDFQVLVAYLEAKGHIDRAPKKAVYGMTAQNGADFDQWAGPGGLFASA